MYSSPHSEDDAMMSEINMTPLVDVMLVLLIVFIITVPVLQHAVPLSLPQATSAPEQLRPETVQLAIDAQGQLFWNGQKVSEQDLTARMRGAAAQPRQLDLQLRADRAVRYEVVARTLAAAQQAGLTRVGFVTEPAR